MKSPFLKYHGTFTVIASIQLQHATSARIYIRNFTDVRMAVFDGGVSILETAPPIADKIINSEKPGVSEPLILRIQNSRRSPIWGQLAHDECKRKREMTSKAGNAEVNYGKAKIYLWFPSPKCTQLMPFIKSKRQRTFLSSNHHVLSFRYFIELFIQYWIKFLRGHCILFYEI